MFFDSVHGLVRVILVGVCAYLALVFLLRLSGKRTLSKMNAFDLVVTVALGSTLATILLTKDVALVEGVVALALLIGLQWVIAWLSVRAPWFRQVIKSEPTLLYYQGQHLEHAMRHERVAPDEIRAAVRSAGISDLAHVHAVVLETDGSFSVLRHSETTPQQPSLAKVHGPNGNDTHT
ncbi:MAG: DUF421 domain-containing protein [Candidatus Tectimicrobiota bacterium]